MARVNIILCNLCIWLAISVLVGWYLDIDVLTRWHVEWVTSKELTAVIALLSAVGYKLQNTRRFNGEYKTLATVYHAFAVAALLYTFHATLLAWKGVDVQIPTIENDNAIKTLVAGLPSIGTIFGFSLLVLHGLVISTKERISHFWHVTLCGLTSSLFVAIPLMGYFTGKSFYYFNWANHSTAMAMPTVVMLGLLVIVAWTTKRNR